MQRCSESPPAPRPSAVPRREPAHASHGGWRTTRTSGPTANALTSFRITINRTPGVLAKCRITTPSTPSSCDPPAATPVNPRTGASGATRTALPVAAAASGRTRANCARRGPTLWQPHTASAGAPGARRPSRNRRLRRGWPAMLESRRKWPPPRLRSLANSRRAPSRRRQASFQMQIRRRTGAPSVARWRRFGPQPRQPVRGSS